MRSISSLFLPVFEMDAPHSSFSPLIMDLRRSTILDRTFAFTVWMRFHDLVKPVRNRVAHLNISECILRSHGRTRLS